MSCNFELMIVAFWAAGICPSQENEGGMACGRICCVDLCCLSKSKHWRIFWQLTKQEDF